MATMQPPRYKRADGTMRDAPAPGDIVYVHNPIGKPMKYVSGGDLPGNQAPAAYQYDQSIPVKVVVLGYQLTGHDERPKLIVAPLAEGRPNANDPPIGCFGVSKNYAKGVDTDMVFDLDRHFEVPCSEESIRSLKVSAPVVNIGHAEHQGRIRQAVDEMRAVRKAALVNKDLPTHAHVEPALPKRQPGLYSAPACDLKAPLTRLVNPAPPATTVAPQAVEVSRPRVRM